VYSTGFILEHFMNFERRDYWGIGLGVYGVVERVE
jgi:hypothetical protein